MQRGSLPRIRPRMPLVVVQGIVSLLLFAGVWEGARGGVSPLKGLAGFWQQQVVRSNPQMVRALDRIGSGPAARSGHRVVAHGVVPRLPVSGILLAGFSLPGHPWIQLGAAPDAPVLASLPGTITSVGTGGRLGEVQEKTALGLMTYGGIGHPVVHSGETVHAGQVLAVVAPPTAGEAVASLRWQVRGQRGYVNPLASGPVP